MTLSVDGGKFKALAVYENLQDLPRVILSTLSDFTHKTQRMAFILLFRAEINHDTLADDLENDSKT